MQLKPNKYAAEQMSYVNKAVELLLHNINTNQNAPHNFTKLISSRVDARFQAFWFSFYNDAIVCLKNIKQVLSVDNDHFCGRFMQTYILFSSIQFVYTESVIYHNLNSNGCISCITVLHRFHGRAHSKQPVVDCKTGFH